jgi:uncharacterized membrane protein YedE/YeeE
MHPFIAALLGGALIGLSASLLLLLQGRIAGISGIIGGLLPPTPGDADWRVTFVGGLVVDSMPLRTVGVTAVAGLLVGYGTRLGNGCTSGHGICGLSRLSGRSLASVLTFMAAGGVTVFVVEHLLGGLR